MPNTPEEDIQVENETVEPYRGVMIFRTLQRGVIVSASKQTKRSYPAQTFYAFMPHEAAPFAFDGSKKGDEHILVGMDVEAVRALIDKYVPGTGIVNIPTEQAATA